MRGLARPRHAGTSLALACLILAGGCAGPRAQGRPWIRDVRFEGVHAVEARDLARRLSIRRARWLRLRRDHLDPFAVDVDRERIEAYYRERGYFEARTVAADVTPARGPRDAPTGVDVRFVVEEGAPTRTRAVDVTGLPAAAAALQARVQAQLPIGAVFDHRAYLQAKRDLEDELRQRGYAWADVAGRVEVDRRTHEAHVRLETDPGPAARFGHVDVQGQERVSARAVVLHTGIRPDAPFDPAAVDAARGRLYALGVFSSVRVDYLPRSDDPAVADVHVQLRESQRNDLHLGVGLGLDFYRTDVHASATYLRRSWLGGLRTLALRLEPAWVAVPTFWSAQRTGPALDAEARFVQPDWPLPLGRLSVAVGYDLGVEYAYQYHGPRASVGLERGFWRDNLLVGVSYNFQFLQLFAAEPVLLADPALAGRLFGYTDPYRIGWLQQDVAIDLRDHRLAPHAGGYAGISLEEGGAWAGGAFQYEKIVPDVRGYAPLGSRVTLAGRFVFGQLFAQRDLGSPITRRFYLGGPSSQRGFNYERLSPQVPSGQAGVSPIPIGGDQMVVVSAELRVDVVRLFGQWLTVAAFADGGDVGAPACSSSANCPTAARTSVDWSDLHWAAGGGLRYATPIGSVRADLGVRLNRLAPFEASGAPNPDPGQRFAFHLSLGEAF